MYSYSQQPLFVLNLLQIVECAAINLTFVYALLAYIHIRKLDIGDKRVSLQVYSSILHESSMQHRCTVVY